MKKFLCVWLSLIMILAMIPMTTGVAFADSYSLKILDTVAVDSSGNVENASGEGWSVATTPDKIILTLTGDIITDADNSFVFEMIDLPQPLYIKLEGNRTIQRLCDERDVFYSNGSNNKIYITSDSPSASLTIIAGSTAGSAFNGYNTKVTVAENVTLIMEGNDNRLVGDIELDNKGTVNITSGSRGMTVSTFTNSGTFYAKASGTDYGGLGPHVIIVLDKINLNAGSIEVETNGGIDASLIKAFNGLGNPSIVNYTGEYQDVSSGTELNLTGSHVKLFIESAPTQPSISFDIEKYREILAEAERQQAIIDQQNKKISSDADVVDILKNALIRANSKYVKKGTQVYLTWLNGSEKALEDAGYDVKYAYYRSTRAREGFKLMLSKDEPVYTNTMGVRGQMYYYRAKLMVYDKEDNLVGTTELLNCKYGNRRYHK